MAATSRYQEAGVNINLATDLLEKVKAKFALAMRPEMLAPIGGFGGLFQLDLSRWREPVLVGSVDGVGTKLMVAALMNQHDTVGFDIVNHCINDIAVQGAEPLFFLDYIGIGKLRSPLYEEVLGGIADACREGHVALLGGETAEMPGMYGDDYDLVGCIIGAVEKPKLITGEQITAGYRVVGLGSVGLHTNGFSLARKVLFGEAKYTVDTVLPELGESVGTALLRPHRSYWPAIRAALDAGLPLAGLAHITGGGWYDNLPRVLPAGLGARLVTGALPLPPIFRVIESRGGITRHEMHWVFNMGVGMMWVVPPSVTEWAVSLARDLGFPAAPIGEIVPADGTVTIAGIDD